MKSRLGLLKHFGTSRPLRHVILAAVLLLLLVAPAQATPPKPLSTSSLSTSTISQAASPATASSDNYLSTSTPTMANGSTIQVTLSNLQDIGDTFGCSDFWGTSEITGYKITFNGALGADTTFYSYTADNLPANAASYAISVSPGTVLANAVGALYMTADVQIYCKSQPAPWASTYTSNWVEVFLNPNEIGLVNGSVSTLIPRSQNVDDDGGWKPTGLPQVSEFV